MFGHEEEDDRGEFLLPGHTYPGDEKDRGEITSWDQGSSWSGNWGRELSEEEKAEKLLEKRIARKLLWKVYLPIIIAVSIIGFTFTFGYQKDGIPEVYHWLFAAVFWLIILVVIPVTSTLHVERELKKVKMESKEPKE
ncbi:MAG: hypothetical protein KF916_02895 [Microbacteriaceae bacterium]|nr:hypothetical protein [Microbacteriaceae bacterium]